MGLASTTKQSRTLTKLSDWAFDTYSSTITAMSPSSFSMLYNAAPGPNIEAQIRNQPQLETAVLGVTDLDAIGVK